VADATSVVQITVAIPPKVNQQRTMTASSAACGVDAIACRADRDRLQVEVGWRPCQTDTRAACNGADASGVAETAACSATVVEHSSRALCVNAVPSRADGERLTCVVVAIDGWIHNAGRSAAHKCASARARFLHKHPHGFGWGRHGFSGLPRTTRAACDFIRLHGAIETERA
jgi:hypothetical protein